MHKIKQIALASWRHWREISFVYFVQLLLGLIVGLTFCSALSSSLDYSMVLDQLAKGFDRTVFMDLINSKSIFLDSTKRVALSLIGAYLLISTLLQAGWLANIKDGNYSIKSLLRSGIKLFFPFLGIALLSIILIVIYAAVVGISFTKVVGDPLATFSSEKPLVFWIIALIGTFILWSIAIWSWSVSSRFQYIAGNPFFTSLKLGFKTVRKKFFKFQSLGLLVIGTHVFLMFLYYFIMGDRGAPNWCIVLFGILIQQVFAFVRVALRGFGYCLVENLN